VELLPQPGLVSPKICFMMQEIYLDLTFLGNPLYTLIMRENSSGLALNLWKQRAGDPTFWG
jgi:hypothetical protein